MTISERIARLIDVSGMTKTDFASKLNVTQAYISKITNKGSVPSDRLIEDICEKFNVNETWLRTGEGEMFIELSRDEQIAEFIGRTLSTESESFKKRFIAMLAKLDESDWQTLEKIALELAQKKD